MLPKGGVVFPSGNTLEIVAFELIPVREASWSWRSIGLSLMGSEKRKPEVFNQQTHEKTNHKHMWGFPQRVVTSLENSTNTTYEPYFQGSIVTETCDSMLTRAALSSHYGTKRFTKLREQQEIRNS